MNLIKKSLDKCLREDLGMSGDITSISVMSKNIPAKFEIKARQDLIVVGVDICAYYFAEYSKVKLNAYFKDGDKVSKDQVIISGHGNSIEILQLERVVLNYMQHLSGVATLTSKFVENIKGTKARITDTRKTIPNLRLLQKYAVKCGGGVNHRFSLSDAILIKDNHLAVNSSIQETIQKCRNNMPKAMKIQIECDNLSQVKEAIAAKVDIILLDNMSIQEIKQAVEICGNQVLLEASGGVTLDNVRAIAECGVGYIAVGALTHSAPAVDIGMDFVIE